MTIRRMQGYLNAERSAASHIAKMCAKAEYLGLKARITSLAESVV